MDRRGFNFAGAVMALAAAISLAACGGGGGSGTPAGSGVPVNPPPPPTSASSSVAITSSAGSATLPSVGGFSTTASFPSSNASGTVNVTATSSTTLPTGLPALQSGHRKPKAIASNVYLYLSFVSPVAINFNGTPGFTFTLPSTVQTSGVQFYLGAYTGSSWVEPAAGPASVSGQQVTFAADPNARISFPANTPVYIALYSASSAPGSIVLTPSSLSFTATGASASKTFTIAQTNFTGQFTVPSTCVSGTTTVATLAPAPSANTYTVTPQAAGSCAVTITGGAAQTTSLSVSVTTSATSAVQMMNVTNNVARGSVGAGSSAAIGVAISGAADLGPQDRNVAFTTTTLSAGAGSASQSAMRATASDLRFRSFRPAHMLPPDVHPLSSQLASIAMRGAAHGMSSGRRALSSAVQPNATVGSQTNFWIQKFNIGQNTGAWIDPAFTLEAQTAHVNVWVDNSLLAGGANAAAAFSSGSLTSTVSSLQSAAQNAYDSDTAHYGSPAYDSTTAPGGGSIGFCNADGTPAGSGNVLVSQGDGRINFLVIAPNNVGKGLGGYFSGANFVAQGYWNCKHGPTSAQPVYSNEAAMVYTVWYQTNTTAFELQEDMVRDDAHEFQHLINFVNHVVTNNGNATEERFIDEGLAVLSQDLAVHRQYPSVPFDIDDAVSYRAQTYLLAPQNFSISGFIGTDPADWGETPGTFNCGGGCYGSAYLLQRYMYDRCGGDAYLSKMEFGSGGNVGFPEMLAACNIAGESSTDLLSDFAIALGAQTLGMTGLPARYNFGTLNITGTYTGQLGGDTPVTLPGVASVPVSANASVSITPPVGGIAFASFGGVSGGTNVSIADTTPAAGFNLTAALLQK